MAASVLRCGAQAGRPARTDAGDALVWTSTDAVLELGLVGARSFCWSGGGLLQRGVAWCDGLAGLGDLGTGSAASLYRLGRGIKRRGEACRGHGRKLQAAIPARRRDGPLRNCRLASGVLRR